MGCNFISIFKKQKGISLIGNYIYNNVFFYAIILFLFVPKNIKGLELFRESIRLRLYKRLSRKYKKITKSFLAECKESIAQPAESIGSKIIWFCWFQGLESAPDLVKACYKTIKEKSSGYKVCVITEKNFSEYTSIPDYIIAKWKNGIISNAHFSDILRTALLVDNGGIWIDSTVFMTGDIPADIQTAPLFMFRTYKPGCNGKALNLSSWFISSEKNNLILQLVQKLIYEYWQKHNRLCDYFLFHFFVQISLDSFTELAKKIPKYTNETPHFMLFELGNEFDQNKWNSIISQSFCHKLTNKLDEVTKSKEKTFYQRVLGK